MARILILGASSQIGNALALQFSPNNTLYLSGRNRHNLESTAKKSLVFGAVDATILPLNLSNSDFSFADSFDGFQIDLIINVASATSRLNDNNFVTDIFEDYIFSDLLTPIRLARRTSIVRKKQPDVIFVSSVLAEIKSQNREIYSLLKRLQELYWLQLFRKSIGGSLLIVRVGKNIPHSYSSPITDDLAKRIYQSYQEKKSALNYGWEGRLYSLLFHLQPVIAQLAVKLHRSIKQD